MTRILWESIDAPDLPNAACKGRDPLEFFPKPGGYTGYARKICAGCPVQTKCLDFALANPMVDGIWGGTTADERQRMRSRVRRAVA